MKITVHAVGRMKAGPEKQLADRYFERFAKSGQAVGLEFSGAVEIPEGRAQTT
ncbi:MAG: 23S rRNA (pseudouridine(1915)-N(3))-methyltransferase RlmH, partial [Mesorhizobium sp.]